MPQTNAPLLPPAAEQVKSQVVKSQVVKSQVKSQVKPQVKPQVKTQINQATNANAKQPQQVKPQVKQATNAKQVKSQVKQATNANPPQQVKPPKTEKELRMETINSYKKEYRERCEKLGDKCVAVQDCKEFGFGSDEWPVTKYRFDKNDEADQKLKATIEKEHGENAVKDGNKCVSNSMWKDALFAKQMMEIGLLPPQSPQQTKSLTNAAAAAANSANAKIANPSANAANANNAAAASANTKKANANANAKNAAKNAAAAASAKNVKPSANAKKPVAV